MTPGVASAQPVTQFVDLALRLDATEIASSAGRRHLAAEEVGLVEVRGDSLRNGAVIGFRDALIERTTVVHRADRLRASLAPIVTPRAGGIMGAIRW